MCSQLPESSAAIIPKDVRPSAVVCASMAARARLKARLFGAKSGTAALRIRATAQRICWCAQAVRRISLEQRITIKKMTGISQRELTRKAVMNRLVWSIILLLVTWLVLLTLVNKVAQAQQHLGIELVAL